MQRKDPEITNNERIHILTFRAHFKISALLFPSSGNHRMIHKKGGRIRTYGRPDPDLLGWVACFALVASVPKQMRCATQRVPLSPLPLFCLCHYQSRVTPGPAAPDLIRTIILMTKQGPAYFSSESFTIPTSNLLGVRASKLAQPSKGA
uniref:Uncharacterized protein n=2 Tax=Raphanus sativus TaxID=3726 RepID=A0A650GA83_RAPSA|nr:hypothetical protein [Raphanus sativus]